MDDFHHLLAGLPLTSGAGAPAMDANDVHIWTDAILKMHVLRLQIENVIITQVKRISYLYKY
jgi:hypothetical protein